MLNASEAVYCVQRCSTVSFMPLKEYASRSSGRRTGCRNVLSPWKTAKPFSYSNLPSNALLWNSALGARTPDPNARSNWLLTVFRPKAGE
jgi:hypothetical protein